jgi:16S rRNA (cytidine1402-2'-O)-methyltransferase
VGLTPRIRLPGTLYVVATPIGNLEDVTLRALRILREAALVVCEDTRRTRRLLARHGIQARLLSYHKFNERARTPRVLAALERGEDVALVTDGGTPALSDPGAILVGEAAAAGHRVVPVPGPSALAASVSAAGLPATRVTFLGFLPARAGERRRLLASLDATPGLLVLLESPRRAAAALREMAALWGARRALVAREMTKVHEELARGTLAELAARFGAGPLRGEVTIVVEGAMERGPGRRGAGGTGEGGVGGAASGAACRAPAGAPRAEAGGAAALRAEVNRLMREEGLGRSAAVRAVARSRGLDPRALYRRLSVRSPRRRAVSDRGEE